MENAGKRFLEMSKYENMGQSDMMKGDPAPSIELEYDSRAAGIALPAPDSCRLVVDGLREVVNRRRSLRSYAAKPLSLAELSYLLWCTQGVQKIIRDDHATMRTVPSAGARHAFETYLLVNNVAGCEPGLYRFLALAHKLITINRQPGIAAAVVEGCQRQVFIKDTAALFIWVAVTQRMTWRYHQRGYRYLFLDAGHVCQNLYLAAESVNCGCCGIGAFSDSLINRILGLDGDSQFVIYMGAVGKRV